MSGIILDSSSGKPMPGVEIQTSGPRGFNTQEVISDADAGLVPRLLPGTYTFVSSDSPRLNSAVGAILHQEVSVRNSNL